MIPFTLLPTSSYPREVSGDHAGDSYGRVQGAMMVCAFSFRFILGV
jgi:hypothetical protein